MKALEVHEIDSYYGTSHILHGVSLDVMEREVACILGRNGAGKTTTIRSVMGMTPPSSGSVKIFGEEVRGWRSNLHQGRQDRPTGVAYLPHAIGRGEPLSRPYTHVYA